MSACAILLIFAAIVTTFRGTAMEGAVLALCAIAFAIMSPWDRWQLAQEKNKVEESDE